MLKDDSGKSSKEKQDNQKNCILVGKNWVKLEIKKVGRKIVSGAGCNWLKKVKNCLICHKKAVVDEPGSILYL